MILRYKNTNVETACQMLDVTDDLVHEWSSGEVKRAPEGVKDPGDVYTEKVFKKPEDGSMNMGHIELPCGVININYYMGTKPVLPSLLGLSHGEFDRVAYYACYVLSSDTEHHKRGEILSEKDVHAMTGSGEIKEKEDDKILLMGADAVEYLLHEKGITDTGRYILHSVPVIPVSLRTCINGKGDVRGYGPSVFYSRILSRIRRITKLQELGAPAVIMRNEKRMLQELVDALINNGARGRAFVYLDGGPIESLYETWGRIHNSVSFMEQARYIDFESVTSGTPISDENTYPELLGRLKELSLHFTLDGEGHSSPETEEDEQKASEIEAGIYDKWFKEAARRILKGSGLSGDPENAGFTAVSSACEYWMDKLRGSDFKAGNKAVRRFLQIAVASMAEYIIVVGNKKMPETGEVA